MGVQSSTRTCTAQKKEGSKKSSIKSVDNTELRSIIVREVEMVVEQ